MNKKLKREINEILRFERFKRIGQIVILSMGYFFIKDLILLENNNNIITGVFITLYSLLTIFGIVFLERGQRNEVL